MNHFFKDLGLSVHSRWQSENFSLASFPEIARQMLAEKPPCEHVDLAAFTKEFLLNDDQPAQSHSGFGEPELVLYHDPRFYIQMLFWMDGTTDIHQHEFSGAFHVMAGSSIHSRFSFENPQPVSAHLRMGRLKVQEISLLECGATVPIISGNTHIHSLFHLESPSVTVVIRTHSDPGTGPQFTYLPPHLAVDPFQQDSLSTRRKQLLDTMELSGDPAYPDLVLEMLESLDFERGLFVLQNGFGHLRNLGAWDHALKVFKKKHGRMADFVELTLEEIVRRDRIVDFRRSFLEIEHRFFLALLANVADQKNLLDLVAQRYEGPPADIVMNWVEQITEYSDFGTTILDAEFSLEHPPELIFSSLRSLLEGRPKPSKKAAPKSTAELESIREILSKSCLRSLVQ
jgi:hypothetical protein